MAMASKLACGLVSIALSGSACADVARMAILAKPRVSFEQRAADQEQCRHVADMAPAGDLPTTEGTAMPTNTGATTLPEAMGASLAFLIIGLFEAGAAERRGVRYCMENKGYAQVPLTDREARDYAALAPGARPTWERGFLVRDLDARIAAAQPTLVPQLPAYRDMPATIGGLRFRPDAFAAASGPVTQGGTLLTGKVERWRTAVLTDDFATTQGPIRVHAEKGTIFHQVDYRPQRDPLLRVQGATWCGHVEQESDNSASAPSVYCFTSYRSGYLPFHPTGFDWLAGLKEAGFTLPLYTRPILLQEREADDLGQLDFSIELTRISSGSIGLDAYVSHVGRRVKIWTRSLRWDPRGTIILPLWGSAAQLRPTGSKAVSVSLSAAATGTGLRDVY